MHRIRSHPAGSSTSSRAFAVLLLRVRLSQSLQWSLLHLFFLQLLTAEILHHLGCIKPCKWWDKLYTYQLMQDFSHQQYHAVSICLFNSICTPTINFTWPTEVCLKIQRKHLLVVTCNPWREIPLEGFIYLEAVSCNSPGYHRPWYWPSLH